ncbi:MAG TPA: glycosyltransferase family 2 protein [bacterium]|nr:glycosyltransferase family 2 protein [bacterium]
MIEPQAAQHHGIDTRPAAARGSAPLAVIILTRNEEENLPHALASVAGWAAEVWVVDSHSTDRTAHLARERGARVVAHEFAGYPAQRNWALRSLPLGPDWVLFLDADETVTPELRVELAAVLAAPPAGVAGFEVKRRFVFLGRWLRHGGYYPVWLLRVMRHRVARCEERGVDEHLVVEGPTARLQADLLHEDRRPLERWIERHTRYARLKADDLIGPASGGLAARWSSPTQAERTRWWYDRVYRRAPMGLRAFGYFLYRYIVRGGFLDGREGFIYHSLQAFWYRLLIDAMVFDARRERAPR